MFFGKEACLAFSTGYQANLGLISGLVGRGDIVFLDKLDHASIVDGARMSDGEMARFNHGDLAALERKLRKRSKHTGTLIVVDGIYSMEGDIADLPGLVRIARKYGAALAVDDAHSVGVLGPKGDGTAAHFGMVDEVDLIVGTFSKSLASIGGFVAGTEQRDSLTCGTTRAHSSSPPLCPRRTRRACWPPCSVMQREPDRRKPVGEHPPAARGAPAPRLRHRPDRNADRSGADRAARADVPVLAPPLRCRRLHQPGGASRGSAVAVPPEDQSDGHPHAGADRLRAGSLRAHWEDPGGHLSAVQILSVVDRRDRARFIAFPYEHYRSDPLWTPPLRMDVRTTPVPHEEPFLPTREAAVLRREIKWTDGRTDRGHQERRPQS